LCDGVINLGIISKSDARAVRGLIELVQKEVVELTDGK
jgi:hypothetical protein